MPNEIANAIRKFDKGYLKGSKIEDLPDSYCLILDDKTDEDLKKLEQYFYYINYNEFHDLSIKLVNAISKWLEDYGAKDINLPRHLIKD